MKHDGQVKLAIPLGDPAGIGTEVVLKALAKPEIVQNCQMTVIGTRSLLQQTYQQLKGETIADPDTFSLLDIPVDTSQITPGYGNAASGEASFAYLSEAIARTLAGEFQGIVTAPIAKACWKLAGYDYPGQTEVLAQAAGVEKFGMLFVARSPHTGWILRTLLATTHIPLSQVPTALTPEVMSRKLDLLMACLQQDFAISRPKIAIAGLNPHSGEQGQLGSEERDWLQAWLAKERQTYPQAELIGLIPPDTMWVKPARAWYGQREAGEQGSRGAEEQGSRGAEEAGEQGRQESRGGRRAEEAGEQRSRGGRRAEEAGEQRRQESGSENREQNPADAYLALYHDQGLIPVKLMAFDQAINTTIGLPFIRTSPDHGTAFDIAGKGIADPHSAIAAIQLAAELVRHRLSC